MTAAIRTMLAVRDRCEAEGYKAGAAGALSFDNPYSASRQPEEFSAWRDGWYSRCGQDKHPKIAKVPAAYKHPEKSPAHPAQRHTHH